MGKAERRRSAFVEKIWADADQQTIDRHPTPEDGCELINDQNEIISSELLMSPAPRYIRERRCPM